jgi:hypothetical protein
VISRRRAAPLSRRRAAVISRRRGATASTASVFLGLAFAITATARISAAASPSARLTYVRSMDASFCPDEAALRKAVSARFGYDPFFPWAKKTVVVHLGREGRRFIAHVELVDEGGLTRGTRDLQADDNDCSQIFDATALAISIALDAFAAVPDTASPAPPAPVPPPPPQPPPESAPLPPPPPLLAPESTSRTEGARRRPSWMAGADVLGSVGSAPGPTAGLGAFVALRASAASVELRLDADASTPISVGPVGHAETTHFLGTLAPCAHFGLVSVCAIGEAGWLWAWGSDLDIVKTQAMPFIAAGARLGLELPVSDALVFRIYAEGVFDLDRASFELDYSDVWQASLAEGTLAIGLARRIP